MRIDVHAHLVPRECFDAISSAGRRFGPSIVPNEQGRDEVVLYGKSWGTIARETWDPETRIRDMDAQGVDIQAISPSPTLIHYELDVDTCLWFSRLQNDGIARIVGQHPKRFIGLATVPLQDVKVALSEMDRAINNLGMRGLELLTNVRGQDLDSAGLMPFYKEVEALDVPVFLHPLQVAGADRMQRYYLTNLVGNPLDTALAAAHIIFGGVLEKFPRLKFVLAHGGGNVPYIRGRWDHGYKFRPECKVAISQPPSHYLPLLYFDALTHFPAATEYLIETVGADHVVLGTNYPYDMAETEPVKRIEDLKGISAAGKEKVFGGTAAKLFKLT